MVENVFFYTDFFLIDHFDCMIKMFCLKDQKKPPLAPVSLLLLLLSFISVVVFFLRCGDLCSFFFPPSVMGEYDLRKKKRKSAVERNHGFDITNPPLLSLLRISK